MAAVFGDHPPCQRIAGAAGVGVLQGKLGLPDPAQPDPLHWKEIVPHRPDVMLEQIEAFSDHVVLRERKDALVTWRSLDEKTGSTHPLGMDEKVYAMGYEPNLEFAAETFRFAFSSPRSFAKSRAVEV